MILWILHQIISFYRILMHWDSNVSFIILLIKFKAWYKQEVENMRNSDTDTKASEEEMPTVQEEKYKIWWTSYTAFRLEQESRRVRRLEMSRNFCSADQGSLAFEAVTWWSFPSFLWSFFLTYPFSTTGSQMEHDATWKIPAAALWMEHKRLLCHIWILIHYDLLWFEPI